MKRVNNLVVTIVAMAMLVFVASCANAPANSTEDAFVEETSLTVAVNALADFHDQETARLAAVKAGTLADSGKPIITDANYQKAKTAAISGAKIVKDAHAAARAGDATRTQLLLTQLTDAINTIALYNGGKK